MSDAPGSDEAITHGCTCPILDNAHGEGRGDMGYVIVDGRPLHWPRNEARATWKGRDEW